MEKKTHLKILTSAIFIFAFLAITPQFVHAATLYFSPSSGSHAVGTTLSVSIYVSSADQAMNAASGIIVFPQDKLEVTSLSKTGSIFSLWVQEPSFSNSAGTVNFEGIALNPGFIGTNGKLITINFRVKAAGTALLNFASGSALANDGKGTNILVGMSSGTYILSSATTPPAPIPEKRPISTPAPAGAPSAPKVSSITHPNSEKWYSNQDPEFSWQLPPDVDEVSIYLSKSPTSNPGPVPDGLFSSKSYKDVKDGIWYFHIKFRNQYGWGEISHFRFQVDTKPPEPFSIKFIDSDETENPRPTAVFDTMDSLSGVNYYKIKIGEGDFFTLAPEIVKSNPYTLPLQAPGKRNILVQAFDKAENYSTAAEEFTIKPLQAPIFTKYPKELQSGEILKVKGKSNYPNSQIVIGLQKEKDDPKSFTVQSDPAGNFTFTAEEKLGDGVYRLWAEVVDARGARSLPAEKLTIAVRRPAFLQIGSWAVSLLAVVVPLVALAILLLFVVWYGWHKFSEFRKKLKKEVREAESAIHKAFDLLKEDIREQVKLLEKTRTKRQLTEEEEKVIKQLGKDLDDAEKFVRKELEGIEKEIK